ncbi:MAG: GIY-YIG nuclease family protein [Patescibacteria group bacterium]
MHDRNYWVYILSNPRRTTYYVGATGNLQGRINQHRSAHRGGFTARYGCTHLLYVEKFTDVRDALEREKQIKRYRREKKLSLIRSTNPGLLDMTDLVG